MMNEGYMRDVHQYVFIPNEEYRQLVNAKRDSECLKRVLVEKLKSYAGIKHEELLMICTFFGLTQESGEAE